MNIALISDCFLPEVNGISFCVNNLATEFSKNNKVKVVGPEYTNPKSQIPNPNLDIVRFGSVRVPLDKMTQFVWPNWKRFDQIMQEFKPSVVHVHTLGVLGLLGVWWAKRNGVFVVVTYHTLVAGTLASYPFFKPFKRLTESVMWSYSKWVCNLADQVIAPSEVITDLLISHGVNKRIITINNGVETSVFRTNKTNKTNMTNKIIYVGRIGYEKGVDVIVEAMKQLPDLELILIGEGNLEIDLPGNVKRLGMVDRERLPMEYAKAKLFVTAAQFEVNPLVVLEAMACGLPVIGANKGGMAKGQVIDGVNGILINEVTPENFAEKIKYLVSNEELLKIMSVNARKTAVENDVAVMAEKTLQVYEEFKAN